MGLHHLIFLVGVMVGFVVFLAGVSSPREQPSRRADAAQLGCLLAFFVAAVILALLVFARVVHVGG